MRTICKPLLLAAALFFTNNIFAQIGISAGQLAAHGIISLIGGNKEKKQEKTISNSSTTTKIDGKNVTILRVKEADIKSKAKAQIIKVQNQLDEYAVLIKANVRLNIPKKDSSIYNIQMLDPDWPVEYYENELKVYKKYEAKLEQHEKDSIAGISNGIVKKTVDSLELVKKRATDSLTTAAKPPAPAYFYVNKPAAIIKESPLDQAKTLGVLYVGSYVTILNAVDKTPYVKITFHGITGFVDKSSLVDNIDKITVPNADLTAFKKGVYFKYFPKPGN